MPGWKAWAADRFGLKPIADNVLHRRVARGPWYYGDGATLTLLLGVLVLTGALMTLTYSPHPDAAYESVRHITYTQTLGWFVRALHYWSAGLMVVVLFWHLFRQLLVAGYKPPREGTWLVGVLMFFLVLVMSLTGYVLRWDQRAIYALRVATVIFDRIPWIGDELVLLVQGGPHVGALTAARLYAVHVVIVPLLLLGLAAFHVYLVILHGVTSRLERERPVRTAEEQRALYKQQERSERHGEWFYPETMVRSGRFALVVLLLVLGLAVFAGPRELMSEADFVTESRPAEEWWWSWYSGLVGLLPPAIAPTFEWLFPILLFLLLVLLPFIDRSPRRGIRRRPVAVAIVLICAVSLVALTDLRRRSPWNAWPRQVPPEVPAGYSLPPRAEEGRTLFARYGCSTCHAVAGDGPSFGPDLARLPVPYSRDAMRDFILRPSPGAAMPAYAERITDEHLERILDYIHLAQTFPRR